jgi:hypothetical protein
MSTHHKTPRITVTISEEVERCVDCPHVRLTMDGSECALRVKMYGEYQGFINPEGRTGIHPECPILLSI